MSDTLKAVVFDHSVLLRRDADVLRQLRNLLTRLKNLGLRIAAFSTHPVDIDEEMRTRSLPPIDLLLTRSDVGINKGSHRWVEEAARRLGVMTYQIAYVGDDARDWRTAINAAVFYLHAGWVGRLPAGITALVAPRPHAVLMFLTHFLTSPPRWEYKLDVPSGGIHVRSLLNASAELAATVPGSTFTLQSVLTYRREVLVRNTPAQNMLVLHALSSLLLEGLIPRNPAIAVYPSSTPGSISPVLQSFLEPASKLFHGYFKDDLLLRAAPAPDTSLLRYRGERDKVLFTTQANTVHVNPRHRNLVERNTVLVFDDFSSSGKSLEWARNVLRAAGAERVILLTIGKYGSGTEVYGAADGTEISPYALKSYDETSFRHSRYRMTRDPDALTLLQRSFQHWADRKALPPRLAKV